MEKAISIMDARRRFSELLRDVQHGQNYVVTSRGNAVARISPVQLEFTTIAGARTSLLNRLGPEEAVNKDRWRRDELYE
jgi:prevent-host-death family protein